MTQTLILQSKNASKAWARARGYKAIAEPDEHLGHHAGEQNVAAVATKQTLFFVTVLTLTRSALELAMFPR